jgi:FAD/FMN-containing dehydrogenase
VRPDWSALSRTLAGDVVLPDSPDYETARRPAIARFEEVRPQAVVRCASAADAAEAVTFAQRHALPMAIRSGGHCFAGRSSTRGLVLDVSRLNAVALCGDVAVVSGGANLGEVYATLDRHGRTVAAGCGETVGLSGLTLGGGVGVLGRGYGTTSDQVLAAQIVLADGRTVDCSDDREAELFWALRGGGSGTFGVVTSLTLRTVPAPCTTAFALTWTNAAAVVDAWQRWAPGAPAELSASVVVHGDPPVATVFGTVLAVESEAERLLNALTVRVGTDPVTASFEYAPFQEAKRALARLGDRPRERRSYPLSRSEYFRRPLPPDAVAQLVALAGDGRELDFTPLRGAYDGTPAHATAYVHRGHDFLLKHEAIVDVGASEASARRWLATSARSAHPWGSGQAYQNFAHPDLDVWARAYHGENLARLRRAKARYDPTDFFRSEGGRS